MPHKLKESDDEFTTRIEDLERRLFNLRGEAYDLIRELRGKRKI